MRFVGLVFVSLVLMTGSVMAKEISSKEFQDIQTSAKCEAYQIALIRINTNASSYLRFLAREMPKESGQSLRAIANGMEMVAGSMSQSLVDMDEAFAKTSNKTSTALRDDLLEDINKDVSLNYLNAAIDDDKSLKFINDVADIVNECGEFYQNSNKADK